MAVDDGQPDSKWRGQVSANLFGCSSDQVWPLLEDFFNLHKWLPTVVDACYGIRGTSGERGCIRYCAKTATEPVAGSGWGHPETSWTHEKLLAIDPAEKWLSYEIVDSNIGFATVVATMKVLPLEGSGGAGHGCQISWSFVSDPMEGWSMESLVSIYEYSVQTLAETIREYLPPRRGSPS